MIPRTEKFDVREGKGEEESADTYNEYIFDISYAACMDQEKQGLVTLPPLQELCLAIQGCSSSVPDHSSFS